MIGIGLISIAMASAYAAWCWRDVRLMEAVVHMKADASDYLRRRLAALELRADILMHDRRTRQPPAKDNISRPSFGKKPGADGGGDNAA